MAFIGSTVPESAMKDSPAPAQPPLPPLEEGDHLDQPTFHRRYEAMPSSVRAELIGGIVFMPSRPRRLHGRLQGRVAACLAAYDSATPGTEAFDTVTVILGEQSEPQPDGSLLIAAPGRGQTRDEEGYIAGAPELVVEVAAGPEAIDLHRKRDDYEKAGVREYVVVVLRTRCVLWFVRRNGAFEDLPPGSDGVFRSEVFPGLWLDPEALLRLDGPGVLRALQQGLASPEHAAFVARLAGPPAP
jgi:Uma2 family endonuclease